MGPADDRYEAAAREYDELRRRFGRSMLLAVVAFAPSAVIALAFGDGAAESAAGAVAAVAALVGGAFIVRAVAVWLRLLNWRCPRCGERFLLGRGDSLPTDACKH